MRIDYHVHTDHSYDSDATPEHVVERATVTGLDAICVTDHGTVDGALATRRHAPPQLDVIVGCELDADDGTQVIGLGLEHAPPIMPLFDLFDAIKAQGGLLLIPHPYRRGSGALRPERRPSERYVGDVLAAADLIECYNGRDSDDNNLRSRELAAIPGIAAVAGSDAHTVREIGSVFVEYRVPPERHGHADRDIWHPARAGTAEPGVKRRMMELYHRHERRLPSALATTYRDARRRLGRDGPPRELTPLLQLSLDESGGVIGPPMPPAGT